MAKMTARLNYRGNYTLDVDGVRFGTLFMDGRGRMIGGSFVDDDVVACYERLNMPCDTVAEALARARRAYEIVAAEKVDQGT